MKKLLSAATAILMFAALFVGCASTNAKSAKADAPAAEEPAPLTEPVELVYGVDYWLEPVFGEDFLGMNGQSIYYYEGSKNSNNALLFQILDPSRIQKDTVINIEYELGSYDPNLSCQVCIQPASLDGADYSNQSFPILYNQFEPDDPKMISVDCNKLLKSSVKKELAGFRIVNNGCGSYENFTWADVWDFTITKVTLAPAAN